MAMAETLADDYGLSKTQEAAQFVAPELDYSPRKSRRYNPAIGFRWLVESDGHWSYVTSVPPGEVVESGNRALYGGKSFKIFQDATARVEFVEG